MFRKWTALIVLVFAIALLAAGCGNTAQVQESDVVNKVYTYENDGFGGDFTITINEDGTFSYYEGMLSSYIGTGEWSLDGDTLVIQDSLSVFHFKVDGDDLVYHAKNSSNFTYIKVVDGERFFGAPLESES